MSTLQDCTRLHRHCDVSQTKNCLDQLFVLLVQRLHAVPTQDLQSSCVLHLEVPAGLVLGACVGPLVLLQPGKLLITVT